MKKRNKTISLSFLLMFLIQILIISGAFGLLNEDEDLTTNITGTFESNSLEIFGNSLMPIGTWTNWQQPMLDTGIFQHQYTKIDFSNIQWNETISSTESVDFSKSGFGNETVNSSEVQEYDISAGFGTTISANTNYNYSYNQDNITSITQYEGTSSGDSSDTEEDNNNYLILTSEGRDYVNNILNNIGSTIAGDSDSLKSIDDDILQIRSDDATQIWDYINSITKNEGSDNDGDIDSNDDDYYIITADSQVWDYVISILETEGSDNDGDIDSNDDDYYIITADSQIWDYVNSVTKTKGSDNDGDLNSDNNDYYEITGDTSWSKEYLSSYSGTFSSPAYPSLISRTYTDDGLYWDIDRDTLSSNVQYPNYHAFTYYTSQGSVDVVENTYPSNWYVSQDSNWRKIWVRTAVGVGQGDDLYASDYYKFPSIYGKPSDCQPYSIRITYRAKFYTEYDVDYYGQFRIRDIINNQWVDAFSGTELYNDNAWHSFDFTITAGSEGDLDKYIDDSGNIYVAFFAYTREDDWLSMPHIYLYLDYLHCYTEYRDQSYGRFNFDSGVLNGVNDYYLFFQAKTTSGTCYLKYYDGSWHNLAFDTTDDTWTWYAINNVQYIDLYIAGFNSGIGRTVKIDYLYLIDKNTVQTSIDYRFHFDDDSSIDKYYMKMRYYVQSGSSLHLYYYDTSWHYITVLSATSETEYTYEISSTIIPQIRVYYAPNPYNGAGKKIYIDQLIISPLENVKIDYGFSFDDSSSLNKYQVHFRYKVSSGTTVYLKYSTNGGSSYVDWKTLTSTSEAYINEEIESSQIPKFQVYINENPHFDTRQVYIDQLIISPLENVKIDYRFSFDDSSSINIYQVHFRYKVSSGTTVYLKYSTNGGSSYVSWKTLTSTSEAFINEMITSDQIPMFQVYINEDPHFDTRQIYIDQLIISPLEWSEIDYRFSFDVEDPTFSRGDYNFNIYLKYKCSSNDRVQISVFTDNGWEYYQTLSATSYSWYNFSVYTDFSIAYPVVRILYSESQSDDYYDTTDFYIEELTILPYKRTLDYKLNIPYTNKTSVDNIYNLSIVYSSSDVDFYLQYEDSGGWVDLTSLSSAIETIYSIQITSDISPDFRLFYNGSEDHNTVSIKIDKFNITSKYHPFSNVYVQNFTYVCVGTYNENYTININPSLSSYGWNNGTEIWFFGSDYFNYYNGTIDLTVSEQNITYIFTVAFNMEINVSFSLEYSPMCWKSPTEVNLMVNGNEVIDLDIKSGYVYLTDYLETIVIEADLNVLFELDIITSFSFEFDLEILSKTHLYKKFKLLSNHIITLTSVEYISNEIQIIYSLLNGIEYGNDNPFYPDISMNPNDQFILDVILSIQTPISRELSYYYGSLGSGSVNLYLGGTTSSYSYLDKTRFDSFNLLLPESFDLNQADVDFSNLQYTPEYETNESENIHDSDYESQAWTDEEVNWLAYYYYSSKNGIYHSEYNPTYNYLEWTEDFDSFESWIHHQYYPNDQSFNGSSYSFGSILLQNRFPNDFYSEDFDSWVLDFNSSYTSSSFSNGDFSSQLNTGSDNYNASQSDINLEYGSIETSGNLRNQTVYDYYNATYNFHGETGLEGEEISFIETDKSDGDGLISVLYKEETLGHKDVLKLHTQYTGVFVDAEFQNHFSGKTTGEIEFWVKREDINGYFIIGVAESVVTKSLFFKLENDNHFYYFDTSWHSVGTYNIDQWYHIRFQWDCATDWHLWIDGVSIDGGSGYGFRTTGGSPTSLNAFWCFTDANKNTTIYMDAIGYSWEGYNTYDNMDFNTIYGYYNFSSTETGHYPATWSFEGDADGTSGTNIDFVDQVQVATEPEIIGYLDGHRKVLMHECSGAWAGFWHYISRTNGTIEFWIQLAQTDATYDYQIYDGSQNDAIWIQFSNTGNIKRVNDAGGVNIMNYVANVWYHFRIEFELGCKWYLWIDGDRKDTCGFDFRGTPTLMDRVRFLPEVDGGIYYWDAYGESWDSDYDIGDNYHWQFYSSEPYDFEDDDLSSEGDYYGTYSFEDEVGKSGTDIEGITWVDLPNPPATSLDCISSLEGHKAVINFTADVGGASFYQQFDSKKNAGEFEFWVYSGNANSQQEMSIREDSGRKIWAYITSDNFKWRNGTGFYTVRAATSNTWYHIRYKWYADSTWDWYIDGILELSANPMYTAMTSGLNRFNSLVYSVSIYFDAFGYSWETYTVSDNINPYGRPVDISEFIDSCVIGCDTSVAVSGEFAVHKKFLNMTDYSATDNVDIFNNLASPQTSGVLELYFYITNAAMRGYIYITDSDVPATDIYIDNDLLYYYDGASHSIASISDNTWYHIRIDFDCGTDTYDIYLNEILINADTPFLNARDSVNKFRVRTYNTDSGYSFYIDAIQYSWEGSVGNNLIPDNYPRIGFTINHQLSLINNTIEFLDLSYAYYTNLFGQEVNLRVYDFENSEWVLINSSMNNDSFYLMNWLNYTSYDHQNLDFLNNSNYIYFKLESYNYTTDFSLFMDVFNVYYNWTKTSGNLSATIEKNIDFPLFLDLYDSDADYQKLYNITTSFQYRFTNYTYYDQNSDSNLTIDGDYIDSVNLNNDGNWHIYFKTFIYDSNSLGGFNFNFNISNGLLEIQNFNYTIFFLCEGNSIDLYQLLTVDNQFDISDYHSSLGIFSINITYDFTNTSDPYISNYSNGIDSSQLRIEYNLEGLDTGWHTYIYTTNISESLEKTFNTTYNLDNDFSDTLKNFTIDFYLLGNSSELTLYNISLYDHDILFDSVNEVSINDTFLYPNQDIEISVNGTDPHISHFTLNQTCLATDTTTTIYNISILNNQLYSWSFGNSSAGDYHLWFIFYDECGNYEEWVIDISIVSGISINLGYENPIYVNQNASINVNIYSTYYINESYYSNGTDYIQYSSSQSYNLTFSFNVLFNETQYYNISVKAVSEYGDLFWTNITDLFVAKRDTIIDFIYFSHETDQNDYFITEINLRETIEHQVLSNRLLNYSITAPNDTVIVDSNQYTNINGTININISLSLSWEQGFYEFNCSFLNTTNQYLWYYQMWSFEIFPVMRIITDSTDVNLTVNDVIVGSDNHIQINTSESGAINLDIFSLDDLTFDLIVDNVNLTFTEDYDYSEYINLDFEFNRTAIFSSFNIYDMIVSNIPINFSLYYLNNLASDNYIWDIYTQTLIPSDLVGEIMYDDETFNIQLRYLSEERVKTQITSNPRTDSDSVLFSEMYYVDYELETPITYSYWYFEDNYDINSIELYHLRTSDTVEYSEITKDINKYYLIKECYNGDLFNSTLDYNPNWVVSYSVVEQTSIYSKTKIDYKADFNINNVSIILSLNRSNIFADLTLNHNQNDENISIIIPNINFTTTTQTIYIEGNRIQESESSLISLDSVDFNEEFVFNEISLTNNTIDVNPNYYADYDIISNNGTYSKINIDYKADLNVDNINISIDLSAYSLYNENWTYNAEQSLTTFVLRIPSLDFITSIQTLSIEGYSSIPYSTFNYYSNEEIITIRMDNYSIPVYYNGYLTYDKYSTAFFIKNITDSWTIDGVHYIDNYYTVNQTSGFFRCEGFDPSITSSYLRFKAMPISNITRVVNSTGVITYIIECNFPISNAILEFIIEESGRFTLETPDDDNVLELYDVNDVYYYYYLNLDLEVGINYFVIRYTIHTLADDLVYLIPLLIIIGIMFILYWRTRKKEKKKQLVKKEKKWYQFWKWRINVKDIKNIKSQSVKYIKKKRGKR